MRVRRATPLDIDFIKTELSIADEYYGTKYSLFGDDDAYRSDGLRQLIDHQLVLISETDDYIKTGFILGTVTKHFFNPKIKKLTMLLWWVKKEFRKTRAGSTLLNTFVKFGKDNCDWIWLDVNVDAKIKDGSLEKMGFKHKEKTYLMEI